LSVFAVIDGLKEHVVTPDLKCYTTALCEWHWYWYWCFAAGMSRWRR